MYKYFIETKYGTIYEIKKITYTLNKTEIPSLLTMDSFLLERMINIENMSNNGQIRQYKIYTSNKLYVRPKNIIQIWSEE